VFKINLTKSIILQLKPLSVGAKNASISQSAMQLKSSKSKCISARSTV